MRKKIHVGKPQEPKADLVIQHKVLEKDLKLFMTVLKAMPEFERVRFIILFGSHAERNATPLSDIDIAIYFDGTKRERFTFRLTLMGKLPDVFDVQTYQDLPLYIQPNVLKGKVIYARDMDFVYALAYETIKRFEDFKREYYEYVDFRRIVV